MDKEITFVCPRCEQTFTMEELIKHNNQALMDYINAQADESLSKKEAELVKKTKDEIAKDYANKEKDIKAEYDKKINGITAKLTGENSDLKLEQEKAEAKLRQEIRDWSNKYSNLDESVQQKLELQKQQLSNEYASTTNADKNTIKELTSKIESIKKEMQTEKSSALQAKELELSKEFNKEINKKSDEINDFKETIANLNSTIKDLQNKISNKDKEFEAEKTTSLQAKELELSKVHQLEVNKLKDEINDLKIENNKNRVMNNKTKGENFEHEVEGELRKTFSFNLPDEIQKANEVNNGRKADYIQIVKNVNKKPIGKIVYEVKNAAWSDAWIPKLASECADNKTKYGILIAATFNEKYHEVPFVQSDEYENIFITDPFNFIFVAQLLRKIIILENEMTEREKIYNSQNKDEIFKEYEKKINAVKKFMVNDLPKYQKAFNTQMKKLVKVKKSLTTNAGTMEKAIDALKEKTETMIFQELSKITEKALVPIDSEEGAED